MPCDNIRVHAVESCQNWAWLSFYPGYKVSDRGDVMNPRGKLLRQQCDGNNALKVNIGKSTASVHKLVLRAFTGHPVTAGYWVKHLNGDRSDNRLENLVWAGSGANTPGRSWRRE